MNIINKINTDYHLHSSNFSDGTSSVDEIVKFAGEIGLTEIAITDHSDLWMGKVSKEFGYYPNGDREMTIKRWKNVFNDVKVIFGVEGDLIDEKGKICSTIQNEESDFIILSVHKTTYSGDKNKITEGLIKSIEKHKDKIKIIGHPIDTIELGEYIDIKELIKICNKYDIALELNCETILDGSYKEEDLIYMLKNSKNIYFNSDAHTLYDLKESKNTVLKYLKEKKYID